MAGASSSYHEPVEELSSDTRDRHRAIVSLMEELEAVDWYDQRVQTCTDPELAAVLAHNRDEEKEHAVMTLEWLRRRDTVLDAELREQLFHEGPIAHGHDDHGEADAAPGGGAGDGSLGIGSLRGESV